ncbi:SDR family oxidoreductase [uncultured Jatrophihabitans sp.]|uniref:SDR family oxidoreductase n=1 Tax=uncultured Jatrophihabitans sp. TaxID=1610747 RepID=UPI0035CADC04
MDIDTQGQDASSRVAVVTGGTAGVGRAVVRELAAAGFDVAVLARGQAGLDATTAEVRAVGRRACGIPTDVAHLDQVEAAVDTIEAELGPISVWVNNAFVGALRYSWDLPDEDFRRITEVTYFGQVNGMQAALRVMRPREQGSIVNVSSSLAHRGIPLQSAYCGAKHAIKGYTESLRVELAATGSPVTVSLVTLPGVNTPQFDWNDNQFPERGHPMPVPPIYQPEVAARTIVDVAQRPRHDAWVGAPTVATVLGNRFAPGLVDWQLRRSGVSSQFADGDLPRYPNNLHEPGDETHDRGAHGSFDDQARDSDPVSWLGMHLGRVLARTASTGLGLLEAAANRVQNDGRNG